MKDKYLDEMKQGSKAPSSSFIMIYDDIDNEVAKQVTQYILETNYGPADERPDYINMLINSQGGLLTDAFAIIDIMKSSVIPIRTIGLGQIASAALMIFLTGNERILTPNTSIMSHIWSGGSMGKASELFAITKEFNLTTERMMDHYMKHTGMTKKKISETLLTTSDVYLSADEALKLGICDRVALLK